VALLLPQLVPYVPTGLAGRVSHRIAFVLHLPLAGIFSSSDHSYGATLGNRVMTLLIYKCTLSIGASIKLQMLI
jgi:hypothetical protein